MTAAGDPRSAGEEVRADAFEVARDIVDRREADAAAEREKAERKPAPRPAAALDMSSASDHAKRVHKALADADGTESADAYMRGAPTRREMLDMMAALIDANNRATARIEALEKHGIRYAGSHQRALAYRQGDVVTRSAAMWVALRDVEPGELPGEDNGAWQLSEKLNRESGR